MNIFPFRFISLLNQRHPIERFRYIQYYRFVTAFVYAIHKFSLVFPSQFERLARERFHYSREWMMMIAYDSSGFFPYIFLQVFPPEGPFGRNKKAAQSSGNSIFIRVTIFQQSYQSKDWTRDYMSCKCTKCFRYF